MTSTGNKPDLAASSMTGDVSLDDALGDAISAVSFSPAADILAATSWDGGVRLYVIGQQDNQKAIYNHEGPALDVCWSTDGSKVISGGSDCCARLLDVSTGVSSQVASHQASVKNVRWIDMHGGLLLTGSWDKSLRVCSIYLSLLATGSTTSSFALTPDHTLFQVLGSTHTKSCGNRQFAREVLRAGCTRPATGRRYGREAHTNLQPLKSYRTVWFNYLQSTKISNSLNCVLSGARWIRTWQYRRQTCYSVRDHMKRSSRSPLIASHGVQIPRR
jgi:WD40 repeat protein